MAVQQAAETDISGDPQPTPHQPSGQAQQAGQRFQPPAQQAQPPSQPAPPSDAAKQQPKGKQPRNDQGILGELAQRLGLPQGVQQGLDNNPFLPGNQDKLFSPDAWWKSWQSGRAAYDAFYGAFLDRRARRSSVQNVWEQNSAQGAVMRYLLSGNPLLRNQQQAQQQAGPTSDALGMTADPSLALGGGGKLGMLAAIGAPLVAQGVFGQGGFGEVAKEQEGIAEGAAHPRPLDPGWYADMLWSATAAASVLGGGKFGALRLLGKLHPEIGSHLGELDASIADHNRLQASAQEAGNPHGTKDWIAEAVSEDPQGGGKVLAPGTPEEQRARKLYELSPTGEFKDVSREQQQEKVSAWKRNLGISTPAELVDRAVQQSWTGKQANYIIDHVWKQAEMPYDLVYDSGTDRPLTDPRYHAEDIEALGDEKALTSYVDTVNATDAVLSQVGRGPFQTSEWVSGLRSLMGLNRGTDWAVELWAHQVGGLLHDIEPNFDAMRAAQEGDEASYQGLRPQEKAAVDAARAVFHQLDKKGREIGQRTDRQPNFFPRVPVQPERAPGGMRRGRTQAVIAGQRFRHRVTEIGVSGTTETGEPKLVAREQYKTTEESNAAIDRQREEALTRLTDAEGKGLPLPDEFAGDDHAQHLQEQYKKAATPAARDKAATDLKQYVNYVLPHFETNWYKAVVQGMSRQSRAVHAHQAALMMQRAQAKVGGVAGLGSMVKRAAYDPNGMDQRALADLRQLGYRTANAPGYERFLWHPKAAEWIDRADGASGLGDIAAMRVALQAERAFISSIMYFPTVHGVNMTERMGAYAASRMIGTDPLGAAKELLSGPRAKTQLGIAAPLATLPDVIKHGGRHWYGLERDQIERRLNAFNAGVVPPSRASRYASELMGSLGNSIGDARFFDFMEPKEKIAGSHAAAKLVQAGKTLGNWHNDHNELFWALINDWMVSVFETEKTAALRTMGMDPERLAAARSELKAATSPEDIAKVPGLQQEIVQHQAAHRNAELWAARRANTWGGHVLPEDWNPIVHEAARLLFFAPNWWRSKIEQMIPLYKDAGFEMTAGMRRAIAEHEVRTVVGLMAWQKITGNVLNMMTSGHPQWQNQPGAQDQIELTLPWTDYLPAAIGIKRSDPRTGARRTWENPLARQQREIERIAGLEATHPAPKTPDEYGSDVREGTAHAFADRLSPLAELSAGALNIDAHRSLMEGQIVHIDPTADHPTPDALIASLLYTIPGGTDILYAVQQAQQQAVTQSPDGTQVNPGLQGALAGLPKAAGAALFSWALGTNPAFDYAVKTRGAVPSDAQYRDAKLEDDQYQSEMNVNSAKALAGQMSASDWRTWYHDRALQHATTMRTIYKGSPQYTGGTMGMVSQWEALYDQATDPASGQLDPDRLSALQAEFRSGQNQGALDSMDRQLAKSDTRYPMLKLYHRTLAAYDRWAQQWAHDHGRDYLKVQTESRQYGKLTNQRDRDRFLAAHGDLRSFREARTREFERTPQGMAYGLFFRSASVMNYMAQHHLSEQQVEQEAAAAEGAA